MAGINAKTFENKFNEVWGRYLYAVYADNDADLETTGPPKYSPYLYQNYKNILQNDGKTEGLRGRFTISDAVRQHLTFLFGKMISELEIAELKEDESHETLIQKANLANEDRYVDFMFTFGHRYKISYGNNLKQAQDPGMWFLAQTAGLLPKYVTNQMLIALISNEFNTFLKSLAWVVGQFLYEFETTTISSEMLRGLLAIVGMSRLQRDLMTSNLRAKAPPKPRTKKSSKETTPTDSTPLAYKIDKKVPDSTTSNKVVNDETIKNNELTSLLSEI